MKYPSTSKESSFLNHIKRCPLHHQTIKHLKKGHFHITKDSFSEKFPKEKKNFFIIGIDQQKKPIGIFLNDPKSKKIKARLWDFHVSKDFTLKEFHRELLKRLEDSFKKRKKDFKRNNYFLSFGESDFIPGIKIINLNNIIVIQNNMPFWNEHKKDFIRLTQIALRNIIPKKKTLGIWWQNRNLEGNKNWEYFGILSQKPVEEVIIKEFEIQYKVSFKTFYDFGFYTDMSEIRKKISFVFNSSPNLKGLNLFSYTGAFSLFAASFNNSITSVDMSPIYQKWFRENIALNPQINDKHELVTLPCEKALKNFTKERRQFDYIICDPPSSSSSQKSKTNTLKEYSQYIKLMDKILKPNGYLIIFLNTHQINRKKFNLTIKKYLNELKLSKDYKISLELFMSDDCPIKKGFEEGDYLKGLVLKKHGE